jgi:hypothetical protein
MASGAVAGLAVLGMLVVALWPESGVTYRNFQCVEIGMSQEEVEALFGVPPGLTAPNGRSWWSLLFL